MFEAEGVNTKDLKRIKAEQETNLYRGVSTVLNKAFQLVQDNEFIGDPSYITETAKLTNAVTAEDIMRVYNTYLKGKNYLMTSVVPKEQLNLAITESTEAKVWIEEVKKDVANEEVSQGEEAVYEKTPSKYDRSEPDFGELPLFKSPSVWKGKLENGMTVTGIENNEVPLVEFDITIPGGQLIESIEKAGVSSLLSDLLMQGTKTKSAADLEEAIGMLGASINMYTTNEDFHVTGSCLAKNFEETIALVKEIILEPRWDEKEYNRLKQALETNLKGREANPNFIASSNFNKLIYGENHPFGVSTSGNFETVSKITLNDLQEYYLKLSPKDANIHLAGALTKAQTLDKISILNSAVTKTSRILSTLKNNTDSIKWRRKILNFYDTEYYNRMAFSLSCIILFFIGAPLGSIIRKGGFGLPMIFAIAIYVIYFFGNTFGKNLAEESSISAFLGSWIAAFIMIPLGILLTRRATKDKGIFNIDAFLQPIINFFKKLAGKNKTL